MQRSTKNTCYKGILDHFRLALPETLRPKIDYLINDEQIIDAAFKAAGFTNSNRLSRSRLKKYYNSVLDSVSLPFSEFGLSQKQGIRIFFCLLYRPRGFGFLEF